MVMTVGERGGSLTQGWSLDTSFGSVTRRGNRAGSGSASITVHGGSMGLVGYTSRARGGRTGCESTEWESETSVRCRVAHETMASRRVVMTLLSIGRTSSHAWSSDSGGSLSMQPRLNALGTGSASITVYGAHLGLASHTGRARIAATSCETTEWESETSVRCLVGHGIRGTRRVVMTVGERGGSVTQAWSADVPGVSMARRQNRAGTGSGSITVHGGSMGLMGYTARGRGGTRDARGRSGSRRHR